MKVKVIAIVFGAVVASSFVTPPNLGGPADAADAPAAPAPRELVKVPEFVPIVNFSEFVMAMQTFAAQNPPEARLAAEAMSAKFASDLDAQKAELHKAQQVSTASTASPTPAPSVIVTRPVEIAAIPSAPDPETPEAVPDPVKIVTGFPAKRAHAAPVKRKWDKKAAVAARERVEEKYKPAMGLGMIFDSAEEAPPISELTQKKRVKVSGRSSE